MNAFTYTDSAGTAKKIPIPPGIEFEIVDTMSVLAVMSKEENNIEIPLSEYSLCACQNLASFLYQKLMEEAKGKEKKELEQVDDFEEEYSQEEDNELTDVGIWSDDDVALAIYIGCEEYTQKVLSQICQNQSVNFTNLLYVLTHLSIPDNSQTVYRYLTRVSEADPDFLAVREKIVSFRKENKIEDSKETGKPYPRLDALLKSIPQDLLLELAFNPEIIDHLASTYLYLRILAHLDDKHALKAARLRDPADIFCRNLVSQLQATDLSELIFESASKISFDGCRVHDRAVLPEYYRIPTVRVVSSGGGGYGYVANSGCTGRHGHGSGIGFHAPHGNSGSETGYSEIETPLKMAKCFDCIRKYGRE